MARTLVQPQVNLSLLRRNSLKFQPLHNFVLWTHTRYRSLNHERTISLRFHLESSQTLGFHIKCSQYKPVSNQFKTTFAQGNRGGGGGGGGNKIRSKR
jgi:hypothetical protein